MAKKKGQTVKKSPEREAADKALQLTWVLKGRLKNARLEFLRIGGMLAKVRDEKMFATLHHPDIEDYAEKRLQLGRSSLYKYLQVYDWVAKFHHEWLENKPKGVIPELADAGDLMWIENELARKNLKAETRASLEELKQKALDGRLRTGELNKWRRKSSGNKEQSLKSFLSKFRLLRKRCAEVKSMPAEAITHVELAIDIIKNAMALQKAGLGPEETSK